MAQVRTDTLPRASSLWSLHQSGDFIDCYSIETALTLHEAAAKGVTAPPVVRALLAVRNLFVRPFGLKGGANPGVQAVGIFPVLKDSPDEMILGLNDRHLDFRIALVRQQGRVYMSTWVRPHNLGGRLYLWLVMPFHILICRGMVARMAS